MWEVVNTRNVDNIELVVDHDSARDKHNVYLCNLLHDQLSYNQVLEKECHRLAERQEIPIVDHSFHDYGLKQTCKLLARYVVNYLKKKPRGDDRELRYLLKNDARRKVLERGLSIK